MFAAAYAMSQPPGHNLGALASQRLSKEQLLTHSLLADGARAVRVIPIDEILELTPAMRLSLDKNVDASETHYNRLRQLLEAIMGNNQFKLVYDESTRTAEQTFKDRRGNCLSFTNLFVTMARNLGLEASFQEVEIPPDWSLKGQSFLLSKHINDYMHLQHDETWVVDFNIYEFYTKYEQNIITDQQAQAYYYNNIGAEWMLDGETSRAFANFIAGLRQNPTFGPAWVNLGILYRREGYPSYAEASYFAALELNPFDLVAMSNLASLCEENGHPELAEEYRRRVEIHRMQNPYYRYFLAGEAFSNGDYQTAIKHLSYAIEERKGEPKFYYLMSLNYLMSGEREEAQRWMAEAESVSNSSEERKTYSRKLQWLMQQAVQQNGGIIEN